MEERIISERTEEDLENSIDTSDSAIMQCFNEDEIKLIKSVNESLEMVDASLLKAFNREPSLYEINLKLIEYQKVFDDLTAMYQLAAYHATAAQEEFDEWYSDKFTLIRDEVNPRNNPASKFYSSKEIEYMVHSRFRSEYAKRKANAVLKERQRSMSERLLDGWRNYLFVLRQLSNNEAVEQDITLRNMKNQVE